MTSPCIALRLACLLLGSAVALCAAEPLALYLSWRDDPTSSQVVHWHTSAADTSQAAVEYRVADEETWATASAWTKPWPDASRLVHRVDLRALRSDTLYEFRIAGSEHTERFRTLPARLSSPLVFAEGGDLMHRLEWFTATARAVAARSPRFAVIGGDWAYDDADPAKVSRWFDLLAAWRETMRTPDGLMIPLVPAIGNHEVKKGAPRGPASAATFYTLFSFPGEPGYAALDFGDYLSLLILDTDHTASIAGAQAAWLGAALEKRKAFAHIFPVYHVPAYPSVRPYEEPACANIRRQWVPLFERHDVRLAFEHHDHAYKRTHPLRGDEPHRDGVVYVGDGAWGAEPRPVDATRAYLSRAESVMHALVVTLDGRECRVEAVRPDGGLLDSFSVSARAAHSSR